MICSALAAGMGVQSRANRERDFEQGSAGPLRGSGISADGAAGRDAIRYRQDGATVMSQPDLARSGMRH